MMKREIGIDEAGKGPVIGSMFVAGVLHFPGLEELGVKDSKCLSPARREYLADRIEEATEVHVVEMTASAIDERRKRHTMNEILVECFSDVIWYFQPDRAIVDAADVKPERFAANLRASYEEAGGGAIEIVSEFKADAHYPLVSAASIVAKAHRDRSIRALGVELGVELGSGYPSDPRTVRFLRELLKEYEFEDIPPYVRKSWKTVQLLFIYSPKG
jgi:ribonuclease HII